MPGNIKKEFKFHAADPDARLGRAEKKFTLRSSKPTVSGFSAKPKLTPSLLANLYQKSGIKPSLQSAARPFMTPGMAKSAFAWTEPEIEAMFNYISKTEDVANDILVDSAIGKSVLAWLNDVEKSLKTEKDSQVYKFPLADAGLRIRRLDNGSYSGYLNDDVNKVDYAFEALTIPELACGLLKGYGFGLTPAITYNQLYKANTENTIVTDITSEIDRLSKQIQDKDIDPEFKKTLTKDIETILDAIDSMIKSDEDDDIDKFYEINIDEGNGKPTKLTARRDKEEACKECKKIACTCYSHLSKPNIKKSMAPFYKITFESDWSKNEIDTYLKSNNWNTGKNGTKKGN